ncbi:hypothetical protein [Streptomyces sp. NBC_01244]|uniref:hypothetical protein n=1 Tax=Streptomyces sp. NBC_01244 TaxID=2903797 RepID=UPI002E11513C|nr:hypothetical protein OG247_32475 [Streptomyces sp. NBC_01244]
MSAFLFPDNTVLCNFAAVERLGLLREVLDGRGRWTEAVAREARKSARWHPALRDLSWQGWLGEAIRVKDQSERASILRIRTAVFGGSADDIFEHLGEAETCHVIGNWGEFDGSCWISDDRESLHHAREEGIETAETLDVVRLAVKEGLITAEGGFDLMHQMRDKGRHPRMPQSVAELT